VEERGGGLRIGADLTGGRTQRVGGLEWVPALGPLAACVAVADVDAELAEERRARNLGLELLGRAGLDEATLAVRAHIREGRLVALSDRFRWRGPVAVLAVSAPRFAAGHFWIGLGRAFAERGGLSLARADGVVELPGQLRDPGFQIGDTLEEFPATGTRGLVHAAMLPDQPAFDCTGAGRDAKQVRAETLTAADFDDQIAKLTTEATKAERSEVAKWLRRNYPSEHSPRAIPALERLIAKDTDSGVRRNAVAALVLIVHRHDVSCPLGLIAALRDPVDEVRWEASVLSGPYKKRLAPGVLDALIAATTDDRVDVRSTCLLHLACAAGKDVKARAAIEKAKGDETFEVRHTAHSAWFTATDDMTAYLTYVIRVREEPKAVLNALAEGSEAAGLQQRQRNLFLIGSAARIGDWTEERPDDLAAALSQILDDKSPTMRRGAADLMGAAARKVEKRRDPLAEFGTSPLESLLPLNDPDRPPKAKPAPAPEPSKAYARLLERNADARLRDLATKDADESVRLAARRALERFGEVPQPPNIRPKEIKR